MSPSARDTAVQIGAGLEKLEEEIEALDSVVMQYGTVIQEYDEGEVTAEEVESRARDVVQEFSQVFGSQNWLGETTGTIAGAEPEESYDKFTAYRGLIFAAHHTEENVNEITVSRSRDGPVQRHQDEIIDTWRRFQEVYTKAVDFEQQARQLSLDAGMETEGLDPYAFETPFQVLEDDYQRIPDMNETVNASYR